MKHLSLFDNFDQLEESYSFESDSLLEAKLNQMVMLREGCMASWDFSQFKDFFGPSLNENNTEEENNALLEQAYYTYELGVLYEHKKEWFDKPGNILYLSDQAISEGHIILFKDNTLHIIKESTLDKLHEGVELLNEGWFGALGDFVSSAVKTVGNAVNKYVIQPVKKAAIWVKDKAVQAWDMLSKGAKAVWEFSKKIISAIGAFIKENPLTAIGIGLQILGTILSFIPVANFLSPILAMIAGGITVYEGITNLIKAGKEAGEAKKVGDIVKGGGKIIFGSASLLLGIKDLVASASEALPGMGAVGIAIKTSVTSWATKFTSTAFGSVASVGVGKALGCSSWLAEFFTTLCEKAPFMAKIGQNKQLLATGKKILAKGADVGVEKGREAVLDHEEYVGEWDGTINEAEGSWGFGELLINFLVYIGRSCFSWLYDTIVGGISLVGKAINGLMELPGRITKGIDTFKKKHGSEFIGGIISGALGYAVRPLTNCAQKFIDEYIKPKVKPVTGWMTSLGKRNKEISKKIAGNKKLTSPVAAIKEAGPPKIEVKKVDITAKDKAAIKKIGNSGTAAIVKAGGGSEKVLEKIKKANAEFKKKFPGVVKVKGGTFGQSKSGAATFTYKSKSAGGSVTLFNNGRYFVLDGPNKNKKGDFKADKDKVVLTQPEGGFVKSKNESRSYVNTFKGFSFI